MLLFTSVLMFVVFLVVSGGLDRQQATNNPYIMKGGVSRGGYKGRWGKVSPIFGLIRL